MNTIDEYIRRIEKLEKEFQKDYSKRELLINQIFLAWYVLVEGNLESDEVYGTFLRKIVDRNFINIEEYWSDDSIINFLIGWMASITPWFFDENINAKGLLKKAYKKEPKNLLFKWALRQELNLRRNEIELLKSNITNDSLKEIFKFNPIEDYFVDVLNI